jgi:GT2 family glycosyltransferase
MRIAVYTLTRERLDYTKACFASLQEKASAPFDHFVIDNGSKDGTADWLANEYKPHFLRCYDRNYGISYASNAAVDYLMSGGYDLIIKFDNDCFVRSPNILAQIAELYESIGGFERTYVLSPHVEGIHRQPARGRYDIVGGRNIGFTAIVGGLFHVVPARIYREYRYPETLPLAWGQDDHFCHWVKERGGHVGYIEGLEVEHYRGTTQQAVDYPDYFERKWREEKETQGVHA